MHHIELIPELDANRPFVFLEPNAMAVLEYQSRVKDYPSLADEGIRLDQMMDEEREVCINSLCILVHASVHFADDGTKVFSEPGVIAALPLNLFQRLVNLVPMSLSGGGPLSGNWFAFQLAKDLGFAHPSILLEKITYGQLVDWYKYYLFTGDKDEYHAQFGYDDESSGEMSAEKIQEMMDEYNRSHGLPVEH